MVSRRPTCHPDVRCQLATRLAQAAGSDGVVGGQMMDMLAPKQEFNSDEIITLQRMKTGALFEFACEAGAILGNAGQKTGADCAATRAIWASRSRLSMI